VLDDTGAWLDVGGAIRLAYFIRVPNVGDLINPSLIQAISGCPVVRASTEKTHLLAIGSLLGWATPMSHIWGTGMLSADTDLSGAATSHIHAVRGALSFQGLRQAGSKMADVPVGDPGVLVPRILGIHRSPQARYRAGIVCHHTDRYHPVLRRMMQDDGIVDLNVHAPPHAFLRQMSLCETVLSTSLHGLIFAEALGIPNLWIRGYGEAVVGDFKFQDWFSTMRHPQAAAHCIQAGDDAVVLAQRATLHDSAIDKTALAAAFPSEHLDVLKDPVRTTLVPVEICRTRALPVFLVVDAVSDIAYVLSGLTRFRPMDVVLLRVAQTCGEKNEALGAEGRALRSYDLPAEDSPGFFDAINDAVADYFAGWAEPSAYALSHCAIDMSAVRSDAIDVYFELLCKHRSIECVGPMLRVYDGGPHGTAASAEWMADVEANWTQTPTIEPVLDMEVATLRSTIGTSFALHRAGERVRAGKRALRTYAPFEAANTAWSSSAEGVSTAASSTAKTSVRIFAVRSEADGSPCIYEDTLSV
jgi:hypothetical protein